MIKTQEAVATAPVVLDPNINGVARRLFKEHGFTVVSQDEEANAIAVGRRSPGISGDEIKQRAGNGLRAIGAYCVGLDQFDIDTATEFGIPIFTASHQTVPGVAELVLWNAIGLSRGVLGQDEGMKVREWPKHQWGKSIVGQTLGVLGYGRMGTGVGELLEQNGMHVLATDRRTGLQPVGRAELCKPHEMLWLADIITIHTDGDRPVFGEQEFAILAERQRRHLEAEQSLSADERQGPLRIYLINTARSKSVNMEAAARALYAGTIAGMAVDVWEKERAPFVDKYLGKVPNLFGTAHMGASEEGCQRELAEYVGLNKLNYIMHDILEPWGAVNAGELLARAA